MVRGHLISALTVVLLVITGVHSECVNDDNGDMLSLLFKKLDKVQDKHQDEMTAMREKMQELREKMQEKFDGISEKMQKMQEETAGMKEKLQGHEEINKLKIERIEEICDQFNYKPSEEVDTVSNNETSLAMAVLQLSTSLESLRTCKGGEDTDIESRVTEQMSRLIAPSSPSSENNVSHVDTSIDTLTNGLSEVRTTVEDLQARVQDLVASEGSNNRQLASQNNMTSVDPASNQRIYTNEISRKPRYCHDFYIQGERRDGVFKIYPGWNGNMSVNVWCEFDVGSETGWTVILARMPTEEPVNFSRGWEDYKAGFGDPHTEYWIGLALLYEIVHFHCSQVLHVSLQSWDHTSRHAKYKEFSIGDEESGFQLSVGGYSGDAGDALAYNNGMQFSTKDKDNDQWGPSCAAEDQNQGRGGGFWYKSCTYAFLFNPLREKGGSSRGIQWHKWLSEVNLKKIILKISPKLPSFI